MIRSVHSATDPSIALFRDSRSRESFRSETENKENFDGKQQHLRSSKLTINNLSQSIKQETCRPRVLSYRERVFRFSNSEELSRGRTVPGISVQQYDDDEVFSPSEMASQPASSKMLLLTPSTAHTPLHIRALPSPNIARGVCCSTPNRIKLEREGLTSTEKLVLGRGAFGTVVLGRWRGRKVAIKVMEREEGGRSARRRNSLEGELHAKSLEHQHIVKIFDVHARDDRHAVIIMEYVGSRNLHRLLVELQDKRLGRDWLLQAARQVCLALSHCHSKAIVHLDVKPANVLVTRQGVCKLGDFGCSVSLNNVNLGMDHSLVGTPGYQVTIQSTVYVFTALCSVQAPEFLRGQAPTTQCDVYSLGILLWQLDSREVPFSGRNPHEVMYQVVATQARPPTPSPATVNLSAFTSLYQSCWAHQPHLRPSMEVIISCVNNIPSNVASQDVCRSLGGMNGSTERLSSRSIRY